jgi:hypothetical protein
MGHCRFAMHAVASVVESGTLAFVQKRLCELMGEQVQGHYAAMRMRYAEGGVVPWRVGKRVGSAVWCFRLVGILGVRRPRALATNRT